MNFAEYQRAAVSTAIYPSQYRISYPALGLAGEAGEVANQVKKIYRDDGGTLTPERRIAVLKEVGDCLWYLANLCNDMGVTLDDAAAINIGKLESRQQRGTLQGSGDER